MWTEKVNKFTKDVDRELILVKRILWAGMTKIGFGMIHVEHDSQIPLVRALH